MPKYYPKSVPSHRRSFLGGLAPPQPLIMENVVSKRNQHITFIIRHVCYRRLNLLKCAYFDRLQAAVVLSKGPILSKYAKLIILKNLALNTRTRGPYIFLNTV